MANLQPQNQGFPQLSSPVVNKEGVLTQVWYKFLIALWIRSGGSQGQSGPYVPSDVIITGGTMDGVTIGGNVPAFGTFTNLRATGIFGASNFSGSSSGVNTGNVALTGQSYLTIAGQTINAHAIDLSGGNVTGNLGVTHLNSGTSSSSSTYWRGDGTWANPLSGGIAATITTAKLTGAGTNGSMSFTNGILTSQTPAT